MAGADGVVSRGSVGGGIFLQRGCGCGLGFAGSGAVAIFPHGAPLGAGDGRARVGAGEPGREADAGGLILPSSDRGCVRAPHDDLGRDLRRADSRSQSPVDLADGGQHALRPFDRIAPQLRLERVCVGSAVGGAGVARPPARRVVAGIEVGVGGVWPGPPGGLWVVVLQLGAFWRSDRVWDQIHAGRRADTRYQTDGSGIFMAASGRLSHQGGKLEPIFSVFLQRRCAGRGVALRAMVGADPGRAFVRRSRPASRTGRFYVGGRDDGDGELGDALAFLRPDGALSSGLSAGGLAARKLWWFGFEREDRRVAGFGLGRGGLGGGDDFFRAGDLDSGFL